jgi:hypothetical protein
MSRLVKFTEESGKRAPNGLMKRGRKPCDSLSDLRIGPSGPGRARWSARPLGLLPKSSTEESHDPQALALLRQGVDVTLNTGTCHGSHETWKLDLSECDVAVDEADDAQHGSAEDVWR